jgi:hypothetical protein
MEERKSIKEVKITVSKEEVEKLADEVALRISKNVRVQGFRPGKAPISMVKSMYMDRIIEEAVNEAFASAMEVIPKTLTTNAGLEPINVLVELRSRHAKGYTNQGVNTVKREVGDVVERGLVEAYKVKQHAFKAASETANAILRIDDFINVTRQKERGEEEKRLAMERKRIMDEKIRKLLEKEEELKQIDKSLMERMIHPETI